VKFFILFLFFTFSFAHFENGKLDKSDLFYIKNKKVIDVCINPDWSPIEFRKNGKPEGISIDILKLIAKKIGLKLNFVYTSSWKESQEYLKEYKCDLTPTAVKTTQREKFAIFTRPYLTYDLAIITTRDKPYVTDISAVADKVITRKKGSGVISKLKEKFPNIKIIMPNDYKTMFELVNNNQAYATIATLPVFSYYKKKYNLDNLKIAGFTGWKYPLRMMINKNEPKLREILDCELGLISPKQTQKIYEKWIVNTKPEFDYKQFFIISSLVLLVIIILFIWIYILHQKNQQLNKLSNVKSQFLANMSHELRTPLNAILGFIQVLKQNPNECEKYLPLIESASQTILSEVDDLLNFERLDKDNIKIDKLEFSKEELKNIFLFPESEAKNKGLRFELHLDVPEYLKGDISKIRYVLLHLLDNAIKFTKEGDIIVDCKYKDSKLCVSIKDTGIGISQKELEHIFQEFVQLDKKLDKKYNGIGLGLSIVKKLVNILGGIIKVKSEKNKGSEFYFEIPIEVIHKEKEVFHIMNDRVLLVEDNKANQMFMKIILKKMGLDFDLAQNGLEAVEKYKEYGYKTILMDINMPIMDGITATKKIREYEKKNNLTASKIIAVTANALDGDEERFLSIGMDDYIPKPVDIEKLKKALKQD